MQMSSPIHEAVSRGDAAEAARLLREDPTLVHSKDNNTHRCDRVRDPHWNGKPLNAAATIEIARLLVAYGAKVNDDTDYNDDADYEEGSPLHYAAMNNRLDVAQWLIENGADVNKQDYSKFTPLCIANSEAMAQLLIDHGAILEKPGDEGFSALAEAARWRPEIVAFLLRQGADVNYCDYGGTPLHGALRNRHVQAAQILLEAVADLNVADRMDGNTPLHLIMQFNQHWTQEREDQAIALARQVISRGAALSPRNHMGETPLHIAIRTRAAKSEAFLRSYASLRSDPFPPLPGPIQSMQIIKHPTRREALTTVLHAGLARWELNETPRLLARIQTDMPLIGPAALSPDGEQIAIGYRYTIELRQWDDLALTRRFSFPVTEWEGDDESYFAHDMDAPTLAFSPDGRWLIVQRHYHAPYAISLDTGEATSVTAVERNEIGHIVAVATGHFFASNNGLYAYRFTDAMTALEAVWEEGGGEKNEYFPYAFYTAVSPDARWIAYIGSVDFPMEETMAYVVLLSMASGKKQWHCILDAATVGEEHFRFVSDFRTELLFLSETEIVVGATGGTLLFFDVATGALLRRRYLETEAYIVSLALDSTSSILWIVLSTGELTSISLHSS